MSKRFEHPDCMKIECGDACCRYGADVFAEEYHRIVAADVSHTGKFTKPYYSDGDLLYRTRIRKGGCIFLSRERGCRLHATGHKPLTCRVFPRDLDEAEEAFNDGYLPCFELVNGSNGRKS